MNRGSIVFVAMSCYGLSAWNEVASSNFIPVLRHSKPTSRPPPRLQYFSNHHATIEMSIGLQVESLATP